MPHSDHFNLNFDTFERLSVIVDAVATLGLSSEAKLIDVGGHPGFLARMLDGRYVVTADIQPTGPIPYARVAGANLPFKDGSFSAVLCSDTLEHVPPQFRTRFLADLWRVASDFILLGAPFTTCGVELAEARLRDLDRESHAKANEWLEEHGRYGLPDLEWTWNEFKRMGGTCIALPNGSLIRWFLLFCAQTVLDDLPGGWEVLKGFMPSYNQHFSRQQTAGAAYRHLLVVSKNGAIPEALRTTTHVESPSEVGGEDKVVASRIQAVYDLAGAFDAALSHLAQLGEQGGALAAAYVAQLEKALRQQDVRQLELKSQIERAKRGSLSGRIGRRVRRMMRRGNA
jgi:O-antigen biosynthesis protein